MKILSQSARNALSRVASLAVAVACIMIVRAPWGWIIGGIVGAMAIVNLCGDIVDCYARRHKTTNEGSGE